MEKIRLNKYELSSLTRQPGDSCLPCPLPGAENGLETVFKASHFFLQILPTHLLQKFAQISGHCTGAALSQTQDTQTF